METCKGAKPAGLGVRQVYPALAYSICIFHTCTKRMQIKSKLVFTFFFSPSPDSRFLRDTDTSCIPMCVQTYSYFGQSGIRAQV